MKAKKKPSRVALTRARLMDTIYKLTSMRGTDSASWLLTDKDMRRALTAYTRAIRQEDRDRG